MLFPIKSKDKTIFSMSVAGAGIGLFVLSPLLFLFIQYVHNGIDFSFSIPSLVAASAGWYWSVLFVALGVAAGLGVGYLCAVWKIGKRQVEEVKHCLELVINSIGERVSIVDEKHKILLCNNAYAGSVVGSPKELIGSSYRSSRESGKSASGNDDETSCPVRRTFTTGLPQSVIETEQGADHPIVVEKKTYPMKDSAGNTICCVVIANDITRQRQMEESLRQAQKMEAIGTLAGGIAHDFNNILGAVIGYSDLALLLTKDDQRVNQYLQSILKAGIRGKDLTEQILAFSRKKPVHKEPVVVSEVVQEALKLLRASMPATIRIQTRILAKYASIMADSTQIHQILMNLCANAKHAIGDKPGVLGIQLTTTEIGAGSTDTIDGLKPGRYLKLSVSDTGHGIEKAVLTRIFEPFFTTKKEKDGTGMGLAVVHGITKSCGGAITVRSKLGKGTVFHLLFPLLSDKIEEQAGPEKATRKADPGKGTVMVIDDEKELVVMLKEMLQFLGYQVEPVTCAKKAIEKFRQNPSGYDLVITDYTMPEKTGFELAREMLQYRRDIPIVLTSGYTDTITPQDAYDAGIVDFLLKPLQFQQVVETVRNAIGVR